MAEQSLVPGVYLVPTPIGNLQDITLRALEVLKQADRIACEDTRHSLRLLQHYAIQKPLISLHQHNEHRRVVQLVEEVARNSWRLAVVSDAGTPGISDPGYLIAREAIAQGVRVEALPGPTALIPALVASGLPADRFVFEGFLPVKKGRQKRLKSLSMEPRTMIFYESPHRLVKTLEEFVQSFGAERAGCVARELSKLHEEVARGTLAELLAYFTAPEGGILKGEFVLLVGGYEEV